MVCSTGGELLTGRLSLGAIRTRTLALQAVLGGVADELGQVWSVQEAVRSELDNCEEVRQRATGLKERLADSLAFLLRLANDLGVNLEEAYLAGIKDLMAIKGSQR